MRRMNFGYSLGLYLLAALGLVALAHGLASLAGLRLPGAPAASGTAEVVVTLVAGAWCVGFTLTALRHARLEFRDDAIVHLRFGPLCGTGRIPLDYIRRFGVGQGRSGNVRYHALVLDLGDHGTTSIKVSMYRDWRAFVEELGRRLGQEPAPTKQTWGGVAFDDNQP